MGILMVGAALEMPMGSLPKIWILITRQPSLVGEKSDLLPETTLIDFYQMHGSLIAMCNPIVGYFS